VTRQARELKLLSDEGIGLRPHAETEEGETRMSEDAPDFVREAVKEQFSGALPVVTSPDEHPGFRTAYQTSHSRGR
jgi:hypothetical protein